MDMIEDRKKRMESIDWLYLDMLADDDFLRGENDVSHIDVLEEEEE